MQTLGKLIDVEQHRTQRLEVGSLVVVARIVDHHHRAQHGRQRLVLGADDASGGRGAHEPSSHRCRALALNRAKRRGSSMAPIECVLLITPADPMR
jgi:hypothetical protein